MTNTRQRSNDNTRIRSEQIAAMALREVEEVGIETINKDERLKKYRLILITKKLMIKTGCTYKSARTHVSKVLDFKRTGVKPPDNWGGNRRGGQDA